MGTPPSPTIGLPGLPNTLAPQLLNQLPAPPEVLHGQLLQLMGQVGDMVVTGKGQLEQFTTDGKAATVTFAPSPVFSDKYRRGTEGTFDQGPLTTTFTGRLTKKVNWLGTIMVAAKDGVTLIPPADRGYVWEAIHAASNAKLERVFVVPVPNGYGVNVSIKSEASGGGITGVISKLTQIFLGIGPSYVSQTGRTIIGGYWTQQYLVLEEDPTGMDFSIDLVTPPAQKAAGVIPLTPPASPAVAEQVAEARRASVEAAEAILAMRREREKLEVTVTVPTQRVVTKKVRCEREEFIRVATGKKVTTCLGPNGSYTTFEVSTETATGKAERTMETPSEKK